MRKAVLVLSLVFVLFVCCQTSLGWGPLNHDAVAYAGIRLDPTGNAEAHLGNLGYDSWDIVDIYDMASECDYGNDHDTYEHGDQWGVIKERRWWKESRWGNLDEKRRLAYLCHLAADVGVPSGHAPANTYMSDYEATMEGRAETWSDMPSVPVWTGSYAQITAQFEADMIELGQWTKNNVTNLYRAAFGWQGRDAIWSGLEHSLAMTRAMVIDYCMMTYPTVAQVDNSIYMLQPFANLTLSATGSYDPDEYGTGSSGITEYWWDINGDSVFDCVTGSPTVTLTYDQVMSIVGGISPYTRSFTINLAVRDNEGARAYAPEVNNYGYSWASSSLRVWGYGSVPEPATMGLLAVGGVLTLVRRRK